MHGMGNACHSGMTFLMNTSTHEESYMAGTDDKAKGKLNQAAGKVREEVGDALDNGTMERRGQAQQVKGHAQEAKGKVKDALDDDIDD
jgi:uncharacterized protein YjbJ (UPF0337 family)